MRRSIFWRFVTAYLLFALFGFCTINFTTTKQTYKYLVNTKAQELHNDVQAMANNLSDSDFQKNIEFYETSILNMNNSTNYIIWITDTDGNILLSTSGDSDEYVDNFSISYFGNSYYRVGKFFQYFPSQVLSVYSPIYDNTEVAGYVIFHTPATKILYNTIQIVDIFYFAYFIILFFSLMLLFAFLLYIYIPLKAIRKATLEYANGNFGYDKLKTHSNDELGDVSSSLVYMAHQLNDAEEYQKKFVANISHDFRSPLTSIKGYVEAIIDGTIPYEMQNKYLNIVLSEAQRLERLTNGLINLNTWGGRKPGLIMEDFDIDVVILGILETFEGICDKKEIKIVFEPGKDHFVNADKDKIQQVLYNLIDNAIKFSNNNSEISIKIYSKGDKIFCSIKDFGIGISKTDLNKIWDRFYKTDSSRGKDKTGSGIGLAIVREIINAHDQNIDVISTEGVGTEFIFSLAKSRNKKKSLR